MPNNIQNNEYDLNVCLWKHENSVVFSPRGVAYLCNKCEAPAKNVSRKNFKSKNRKKVRQVSSFGV